MMSPLHASRPPLDRAQSLSMQDVDRAAWAESQHAEWVRRLTSDFAHETLQPLSAISNYLSAWRMTLANPANERLDRSTQLVWLDELRQAADNAIDAVRRFRDFATLGYWHRDEPEELSGWLRQSMQLVKMTHRASGVEIQWDLASEPQLVPRSGHILPRVLVAVFYHLLQFPVGDVRARRLVVRTFPSSSVDFLRLELDTGMRPGEERASVMQKAAEQWEVRLHEIAEYASILGVTIECHSSVERIGMTFQWQTDRSFNG